LHAVPKKEKNRGAISSLKTARDLTPCEGGKKKEGDSPMVWLQERKRGRKAEVRDSLKTAPLGT